jgi:hypothetical protein
MGLIETLVLGGYVWSTALAGWLWKEIRTIRGNHILHLEERLTKVESRLATGRDGD